MTDKGVAVPKRERQPRPVRGTRRASRTGEEGATPAPTEAHLAALRQFAGTVHQRRGEALAALLEEIMPGMSARKRLGVVLDALEGLSALVVRDVETAARAYGGAAGGDVSEAEYRATVMFSFVLADRFGFHFDIPKEEPRLDA